MSNDAVSARTIVRTYLWITGLYTFATSLIWGVNTLFLMSCGFSLVQIFVANGVFTGAMALFEIPTGAVADVKGRRTSFLLSLVTLAVSTLAFAAAAQWAHSITLVILASVAIGLGYTFYSGAVEAWLVDALATTDDTTPLDRVLARGSLVSGVAMLLGTVAGGFIGDFHLAAPYAVRALVLGLVFVLAGSRMRDIGFSAPSADGPRRSVWGHVARVASDSIKFGWREPEAKQLVLLGAAPALVAAWGFHAWQPHFLSLLGRHAVWITGFIAAAVALAVMAGNHLVERATRVCGRRTTLLAWSSGVYALAIAGVGFATSFWAALALYLVGSAASGVTGPVRQAYLHKVTSSESRATVASFASLVSSGGSMVGQAGLGYLAGESALARSYVVGGLASVVALPIVATLRRLRGPADKIIGTAAGPAGCAVGLPDGSGISAQVMDARAEPERDR